MNGVKEDGVMGKVIETKTETKTKIETKIETETDGLKGVKGQKKVVELNLIK